MLAQQQPKPSAKSFFVKAVFLTSTTVTRPSRPTCLCSSPSPESQLHSKNVSRRKKRRKVVNSNNCNIKKCNFDTSLTSVCSSAQKCEEKLSQCLFLFSESIIGNEKSPRM